MGGTQNTLTLTVKPPVAVTGVSVDPDSVVLAVGETSTLTATITPVDATVKAVTWQSSKETVATVSSSGLVEAVGLGYATITATAVDNTAGGPHADTCEVTVAGMSLDQASMDLEVGDPGWLTATVVPKSPPDPTVTWSSVPETVATVSASGEVTAVNAGTPVITASADDGTGETFEVSCDVTVSGVYAAGYARAASEDPWEGAYWVITSSGNVRTDLPSEGGTWSRDVCVLNGDVFVTGNYDGAEVGTPCYWKNGARHNLLPFDVAFGIGGGAVSDGTHIYVGGFYSDGTDSTACYWRISPGDPDSVGCVELATAVGSALGAVGFGIDVADGSVYVAGWLVDSGVPEACYWRDDGTTIDHVLLHDRDHEPAYVRSAAYDIVVASGQVYACGYQDDESPAYQWDGYYWVHDGTGTPSPTSLEGDHCEPEALSVSSSGTVYVSGAEGYAACYWVDGVQRPLSPAGYAYGITLVGEDLYAAGDGGGGSDFQEALYWVVDDGKYELDSVGPSGAFRMRAY